MKIEINEKNSFTKEMLIEVAWEELADDFGKSLSKFSKKIKIPGFRPGKVPRKVIMQKFLPAIEVEFIDEAFQKFYIMALKEKELVPVNQADVSDVHFHFEEPLNFTATFEIEPEITIPAFRKNSIKVQKTRYVSDNIDVELAIEEIRRSHSEIRTVEDGSKTGNFILADLQKLDVSGVPIIGEKLEKRFIKVGEGIFNGENESRLVGLKPGDKTQVKIPDESGNNESNYEVSVVNIEEQILPELDTDFLKLIKSDESDVESWKNSVKEQIDKRYDEKTKELMGRELSDAIIKIVDPEYPPSMVKSYLDRLIEDVKKNNPETELDEEKVRETYRTLAERNLKWYFIRKAIIIDQDLKISAEEISGEIERFRKNSPDHTEEIEKFYKKPSNRSRLEDDLVEKKIIAYLETFAKVQEVEVPTKSLRDIENKPGRENES
ncbi:MAG: trigger factor [Candidatus Neomarinimicrobiota bacterium]